MSNKHLVEKYLEKLDWRVNENSNNGDPTFSGLMLYLANTEIAKYALEKVYPENIANAHKNADLHIHDLAYCNTYYCSGWSLKTLIKEGINKIKGKASSAPAKHLSSLMIQMVNYLGCLQMESAGAVAFNNIDSYLSAFVKVDNLSYEKVKQYMQQLVFNLNIPSRWGSQAVFSNFTFDIVCPEDMRDELAIVGGVEQDFTYGQCQEEMNLINQAFMEVMEEGDSDGQIHTFPIPTYNIDKDFDWDSPITDKLFKMTAKYGVPYFANYVGSDMDSSDVKSMCPLSKDTMLPFKVESERVKVADIDYIYRNYKDEIIKVWTNEGWRIGKPTQMEMTKVYKITLQDNIIVKMGENHLQPVLNEGIQKAKDLIIGDWLPFCKKPLKSKSEYEYRKIINIEEIETTDKYLYCFEVDSEDQLFMLDNGLITHNCRLRLDLSELRKRGGGFFGAGDNVGSIGVVTINMPRIGYLSKSISEFFEKLDKQLLLAKESLDIKRKVINKTLESGILPYTKRYLKAKFTNHFSTFGIVGMNEALVNFMGKDISTQEGNSFANQILDYINKRLSEFQRTSPDEILYNLEATPAEGTSYRFAKHDKEKYPEIITAGNSDTPYYTNSVHLPVDYTDDIFKVLELEDELQSKFTSGTVLHFYLGEQVENPKVLKELTKKIVENYTLPYFSFTPTFSTCIDHGYIKGEVYNCPQCNKETLIWSRVTGYLRPVSSYNIGKKEEFKDRKCYKI